MTNLLTSLPHRQASKYGNREVFKYQDYETGKWLSASWNEFSQLVDTAALSIHRLGIGEQENIAVFTQNCLGGFVVDFAAFANRAVIAPLYATSSVEQISYIIKETESRLLFIGGQPQYDVWRAAAGACPSVEHVVIFDPHVTLAADDKMAIYYDEFLAMGQEATEAEAAVVKSRREAGTPDDLATLIYTSGTTGEPKGVMLTHANYDEAMRIHLQRLVTCSDNDLSLCFLPLTHIFERAWSYFCLTVGMRIAINHNPKEIQKAVKEIRPTLMCSVPRFWEKVYAAVQDFIASRKGISAYMINKALEVGRRRNVEYIASNRRVPFFTECQYKIFDKLVFSKLRKTIGIERGNFFPVAGAPLSDTINEFLHACGISIIYGYGLSETTASVSCYDPNDYRLGTVGTVMPDVQVRLGENNEILVKGRTVMKGYYKKPAETAAVFTADGWFRTGDAGKVEDGRVVLTERIKDLFKTSNGKYIAPQAIESCLGGDKYIEQVAVIGDQRKYVTAIIVPAYEALSEYARKMQIQYRTLEDLVRNKEIIKLIEERIARLQSGFARFEQIKRFTLLPHAFTMERGELTNTLKLRRAIINNLYSKEIEAMYA